MSIDFNAGAVHGVNSFVWSKLQSDLGWKQSDYRGLTPITTPQQQAEFNDMGKPYILYNYRVGNVGGSNYAYKEEYVVYLINSSRDSDIRKVLNLLDYYLSGMDESASLINEYLKSNNAFRQFDYKSVMSRGGQGATPTDQEGGIMDGTYEFAIRYTSERVLGFNPQ